MIKRPMCVFALLFLLILFLLDRTGISDHGNALFSPGDPSGPGGKEAEGRVLEIRHNSYQTNLILKNVKLIYRSKKIPIKRIKLNIKTDRLEELPVPGAKVRVWGNMTEFPEPSNPGQFHEKNYYAARDVYWKMEGKKLKILEKPAFPDVCRNQVREFLKERLLGTAPANTGGLFCAMLLGDSSETDPDDKRTMEIEGISHIMAISGTHLSFLGWGLFALLRAWNLSLKKAAVLSGFLMFQYGLFTGGSPSAMRAVLMFSIGVLALAAGRTYDLLSAVSAAAVLLLLDRPAYLYDCGFLLSFGAVLGISLLSPAMKGEKEETKLKQAVRTGAGLFLAILPIQMYFFGEISLIGIFANLTVLPTAGVVLFSGFLGMMTGAFFPLLGTFCLLPGALLLKFYLLQGKLAGLLPFSMVITGRPELWKIRLYYFLLLLFIFIRTCVKDRRIKRKAGILLAVSFLCVLIRVPEKGLDVTFLDVGQGDCSVIHSGGRTYMLDGGSSSVFSIGKNRILPYLKAKGIRTVDGIFLSHMDIDHINGVEEIFHMIIEKKTSLRVRTLYLSLGAEKEEKLMELEKLGKEAGCRVSYIFQGDRIRWGEAELTCLYPYPGAQGDNNETSQVFLLNYEDLSVLFTGDLEGRGEEAVTELLKKEKRKVQVLKVAHHGSGNSTYEEILQVLEPSVGVISCGKDNKYGHPHKELLQRLEEAEVKILQTPELGAVFLHTDKKRTELSFQYKKTMVN